MNSEKLIVSLIMLLIVFVSTFNVIASTVMLIVEKESDVKTMKAIGMSKKNIKSIFFKHNFILKYCWRDNWNCFQYYYNIRSTKIIFL